MGRPTRQPEVMPVAAAIAEEKGIGHVSHQLLSQKTGIAMAAMFRYYKTREALNVALYEYVLCRPEEYPSAHIQAKLATLKGPELEAFTSIVLSLLEALDNDVR